MNLNSSNAPHRRYNPLKGEWLIVSPQRAQRPWLGQKEFIPDNTPPEFDPKNPLCPTVERRPGKVNPDYQRTFVFDNDFPALIELDETLVGTKEEDEEEEHPLFQTAPAAGLCRVVCFHRRSDLQLSTMDPQDVLAVIDCWIEQSKELSPVYEWVQIFENKGALMGCSNPHPHCQIWACKFLPNEPKLKHENQLQYFKQYKRPLLLDYVQEELKRQDRIVCQNDHWLVVVPFWAVWPYETMLLPKRHVLRLQNLTSEEKGALAQVMQTLLVKYDNLFQCTFPYSMGWQGAPGGPPFLLADCQHWQLHAVFLPPLLRSASVKKFMAGFEMICEPQRDITAEQAAETLRNLPAIHYKKAKK